MMVYEDFATKIIAALKNSEQPLTWTEIRTAAQLPQKFPNNQWVHRLEQDYGLHRQRDAHGVIHWRLSDASNSTTAKVTEPIGPRSSRRQGAVE